jgi:dephospho-CoA kinase
MIQIGITGGIGSGKTTICQIFRLLGAPVFEADKEARYLQNNDPFIKDELICLFGKDIYDTNGILIRKKLAKYIFNSAVNLEKVNRIIHPRVHEHYNKWLNKQGKSPYIIYEAAILFESGRYKQLDKVILVTAPLESRIERVISRDNIDRTLVEERIKNQLPDEDKIPLADFVIQNNNRKLILPLITQIDKNLRVDGKIW